MGPLETSGTSSAAAQGKTPICAAGSRGTGERTGPAVQQARQGRAEPASPLHIFPKSSEARPRQNTLAACKQLVQNVAKHLLRGKSPPQSSAGPLHDRSLVTLPDAMLFAGSDTLHCPRTTFSLAWHFFWLTSHPWPARLQLAAWGEANPPQHGPAISTATPGTSWVCQARRAHGAARPPQSPSSSPRGTTRLRLAAPASTPVLAPSRTTFCAGSWQWQARQHLVLFQKR